MAAISVIVPVYKVESYLRRCVDSILSQSFSDFELILVDDGSPDRCGEICDEYEKTDKRIKVIHQENAGLSAARNAGIDYAFDHFDSEWLTFIDSDDWVHSQYLDALYSTVRGTGCRIAVCHYMKTCEKTSDAYLTGYANRETSPETFWIQDRTTATVAWCKIYHKSLFEKLRYPPGKLHEDEYTTYKALFAAERIAVIPERLYFYYQNPDGITGSVQWIPKRVDCIDGLSEQCIYFHKNGFCKAEQVSALALISASAESIYHLTADFPQEEETLRACRTVLRKAKRRYGKDFVFSALGGKIKYERLARPLLTKLRRKGKHLKIFIGRIFHA